MRNETIMSCFSPGFSSTSVHPGNNSRKVHVSFLPIFRVSTSSLAPAHVLFHSTIFAYPRGSVCLSSTSSFVRTVGRSQS